MTPCLDTAQTGPSTLAPEVPVLEAPRSYEVRTFGCQMNVHDSEHMAGLLERAGYLRVEDVPEAAARATDAGDGGADVVIINTCSVREKAQEKVFSDLGRFKHLKSKGVKDSDIDEKYTPFGHSDYQTIVADIKKFAAGGKTAVISTINGDSNVPFYKELANQGLKATDIPVVAFSVGEEELAGIDTKPLVGHLAAWNYFQSLKNPTNTAFIKSWTEYARAKGIAGHKDKPLTNDPMEATYIGINMWKQAVEKARSTDVDKVIAAMAEALNSVYKAELIDRKGWSGLIEVMAETSKWVAWYNHVRLHSALHYRPPIEAHSDWIKQQTTTGVAA